MTPQFVVALGRCLHGFNAVAEYQSITIKTSLKDAAEGLYKTGFKIVLNNGGKSIFLQNGEGIRINLVQQNIPTHHAWIVQTVEEFRKLTARFQSDSEFKLETVKHEHSDETSYFVHVSSGQKVRIVHRKKMIFSDIVFSKTVA